MLSNSFVNDPFAEGVSLKKSWLTFPIALFNLALSAVLLFFTKSSGYSAYWLFLLVITARIGVARNEIAGSIPATASQLFQSRFPTQQPHLTTGTTLEYPPHSVDLVLLKKEILNRLKHSVNCIIQSGS